jgi:signal transduction histidine kinase
MIATIRLLRLPPEITQFELAYLRRINRIALVFFALHVPVFTLIAWANQTGPGTAVVLTTLVWLGPALAHTTLTSPRTISLLHGIAGMFMGALLVHFGQGPAQIEMHFYFFVVLAMCSVFGNPMVIVVSTVTVALHHLVLWVALPDSVFNYDASWWVVALHALFVTLEAIATCFIARSFFDNVIRLERKLDASIAELKTAHAHLGQAHKLEAIGQLAAGVAHEINTPTQFVSDNTTFLQGAFDKLLTSIAACRTAVESTAPADAELAREALKRARLDYHAKQVPRAIEQSLDGLRRIASLVAALKEFSHPSGGVKAPVDLNQAIQTTITIARNEWKYVAELTTDFDPDLPPVWCLQDELNQVVLNMIVNAAHAIAEHAHDGQLGKIAIRTSTAGELAVIEISDDGAGIPETIRHRIFEPFFTTKAQGKGTGQGLAISYGVIVDKHQGSIDVDSAPGCGTRFTIKLPRQAAA